MPASNSTEALRHVLAKMLCAIGASVDDYTAMRERAVGAPKEDFSDAAIAGTSSNSSGGNLSLTINNNPPQQWEVQPIADKVDELINSLRRN